MNTDNGSTPPSPSTTPPTAPSSEKKNPSAWEQGDEKGRQVLECLIANLNNPANHPALQNKPQPKK
ncbi:MAG: hypothetical protein ACRERD_16125 [Candidatus Binatia bacterium]